MDTPTTAVKAFLPVEVKRAGFAALARRGVSFTSWLREAFERLAAEESGRLSSTSGTVEPAAPYEAGNGRG